MTALLEARLRQRDNIQQERSRRFAALARAWAEGEDELPLLTMLIDDYYQETLHKPVTPPEGSEPSAPAKEDGQRKGRRRRPRR